MKADCMYKLAVNKNTQFYNKVITFKISNLMVWKYAQKSNVKNKGYHLSNVN